MKTYRTSEVAKIVGVHPNTVRMYEECRLIPPPGRRDNGYRIFTDLHIEQMHLARTALKVEVLQNGLRKTAVTIVRIAAAGDFDSALCLAGKYLRQIDSERQNAEAAVLTVKRMISGGERTQDAGLFHRKEAAAQCQITTDTLRNWERNGILTVKRKCNGRRVYSNEDVTKLKIVRVLRCANYSLASILRMLQALSLNPDANIRNEINTPGNEEDIIGVCDRLISSLDDAANKAAEVLARLRNMKKRFV